MKRILIPLPDHDFDTTEVSIPWQFLKQEGFEVFFATEQGLQAQTDPRLLVGVIFGQLGASKEAKLAYKEMQQDSQFINPIKYEEIQTLDYDLLLLPGGHAKGMRQYLESEILRAKILDFYKRGKNIAAICHGVLALARTIDPETRYSVLYGKKVTSLTKLLERTGYYLTKWKLGDYYRTYPKYVEDEVKEYLQSSGDFEHGMFPWKPFTYIEDDGRLITARWPKDAELFAKAITSQLKS